MYVGSTQADSDSIRTNSPNVHLNTSYPLFPPTQFAAAFSPSTVKGRRSVASQSRDSTTIVKLNSAEASPCLLITVISYVVALITTRGVPLITPVTLFIDRPSGRSGVISRMYSAALITGTIGVIGLFCMNE